MTDSDVIEKTCHIETSRYVIYPFDDEQFWLIGEGGEGLTISKGELDKMLHKYFEDNF